MKKIYILLILFIVPFLALGQDATYAKIQLKDGSRIKGRILESLDDNSLVIQLGTDNTLKFSLSEIMRIRFYDKSVKKGNSQFNAFGHKTTGFYHSLKGSLFFGEDGVDVGVHTVNGWMVKERIGVGLGVGYDAYPSILAMPIYAEGRYYLKQGRFSPFYFADMGYAFAWDNNGGDEFSFRVNEVNGGLFYQTGIGLQTNYNVVSLVFGLAWRTQRSSAEYENDNWWGLWGNRIAEPSSDKIIERRSLRRVELSVGLIF